MKYNSVMDVLVADYTGSYNATTLLSLTITPGATSSLIELDFLNAPSYFFDPLSLSFDAILTDPWAQLYRGSSTIYPFLTPPTGSPTQIVVHDKPATTSAITYSVVVPGRQGPDIYPVFRKGLTLRATEIEVQS